MLRRGVLLGWMGAVLGWTGVEAQSPDFMVRLGTPQFGPGFEVSVEVRLTSQQAGVQGFWLGVCVDDARLRGSGLALQPVLQSMNGGLGPEVVMLDQDPLGGSGITCGTIFALSGGATLGPVLELPVITMTYDASRLPVFSTVSLTFCDSLGEPPFQTAVVVNGVEHAPLTIGTLTSYAGPFTPAFLRGDVDQNGSVNLGDAVVLLQHAVWGAAVGCREALDVNGSGSIDLSDAIGLLAHTFGGAPPIGQPFPDCGIGIAQLDCTSPVSCP